MVNDLIHKINNIINSLPVVYTTSNLPVVIHKLTYTIQRIGIQQQ